jgi:hypothetical protein
MTGMTLTLEARAERGRHAALLRHHPDDRGAVDEARRQLKFLKAEAFLHGVLAEPPWLGLSERRVLADLLMRGRRWRGGLVSEAAPRSPNLEAAPLPQTSPKVTTQLPTS